ncbi:YhhN-like protein [Chytriomyces sp. MP71]|nr:YhhN-like protein [Chytriomyces sp. MP71]
MPFNTIALGLTLPHLAVLALPSNSPLATVTIATLTKCLPVVFLAQDAFARNVSVGAGLLLGSVGDAFLCIDHHGYFAQGLGFFLLGHLSYLRSLHVRSKETPFLPALGAGLGAVGAGLLSHVILPKVPKELKIPVAIYTTTLLTLAWRSAARLTHANRIQRSGSGNPFEAKKEVVKARWGLVGAVLFNVSDLTLAIDTFVGAVPQARWVIMGTYYAAQLCIAASA